MPAMQYNKSSINMAEGKIYIDGVEVMDSIECQITFTPETQEVKYLGAQSKSTRWTGYSIKATVVRGRTNSFLKDMVESYKTTKKTPEYTIQGICDDPGSDYVADGNGPIEVTAVGCVPTGDIDLLHIKTDGGLMQDTITFNVFNVL